MGAREAPDDDIGLVGPDSKPNPATLASRRTGAGHVTAARDVLQYARFYSVEGEIPESAPIIRPGRFHFSWPNDALSARSALA